MEGRLAGRLGEDLLGSSIAVTNVILLDVQAKVDDLGCDVDALVAERASKRIC